MSKNIVFCADGTWNGPDQDDASKQSDPPSNVFKFYLNLAGQDVVDSVVFRAANEQERKAVDANGRVTQIAKYLHGVGDSENKLVRLIGGATGAGLITRILRGYTFISRNYVPGDQIHVVGFSRGAYTARALVGLINKRGLLDASRNDLQNKEQAYKLSASVWADYRRQAIDDGEASAPNRILRLERLLDDLPGFFSRSAKDIAMVGPVDVAAVGVWDTVGAMGIPDYNAKKAQLDEFKFASTKLGEQVKRAFHAVAIDEQRVDFTPTLWDADARVTQVLFPGAHSDVGGGYPSHNGESGLSDGALDWMIQQLRSVGVQFAPSLTVVPQPQALAPQHAPWDKVPWNYLRKPARRANLAGLPHHASVAQRWGQEVVVNPDKQQSEVYKPGNIDPPALKS
jgi:uncharacterized protein (DUF2235 family)